MNHLGDFNEDATVNIFFTTNAASGAAVAPSSAFEAADVKIYKNGSAAEKTTTNGLTMTSPFDAITGLHQLSIDTSNDTGDAGFWVAGADYTVVLSPDETVDGQTVVAVIAQFSIENRSALRPTVAGRELGVAADGDLLEVNTVTGHTAQSGDAFARLGAPAGASIAADLVVIDNFVDDLETRLTAARAANLDNLDATVSSRATAAALAIVDDFVDDLEARLTAARAAALDEITAARLSELDAGTAGKMANEVDLVKTDLATVLAAAVPEIADILAAVDTEIAAIKAKTDQLAFTGGNVHAHVQAFLAGVIDAAAIAADAITAAKVAPDVSTEIANALLDLANGIETGFTLRQMLRLIAASLYGKLSGAATTTINIRDVNDTKNRIVATVDSDGNRSAVLYDTT